jgi:hypothetical protein
VSSVSTVFDGDDLPPLTDDELDDAARLCDLVSDGPWFVRQLDDEYAASLVAVVTNPALHEQRWPDFDGADVVAATLVQNPVRYVDVRDGRWDANANFIASARTLVPRLIDEVRRLRREQSAT